MLPSERPGRPASPELIARRAELAAAAEAGLWRTDPAPEAEVIGGVRCLVHRPAGAVRGILLHLHGGAFRMGMPEQVGPFAAALAARCGVAVVCPAYRLAPEHPFPAALDDARAVLAALTGRGPLVLSGDSAGGGLAAGLAGVARRDAVPLAGLMLFSAWLDLGVTSACYVANAGTDPLFSAKAAREAAELYLQGMPATDPHASPLLADLDGYPPTFVSVGAGEVLADDARAFQARLEAAGVPAHLSIVPGMEHVAVTRGLALPGAAETLEAAAAFVDAALA